MAEVWVAVSASPWNCVRRSKRTTNALIPTAPPKSIMKLTIAEASPIFSGGTVLSDALIIDGVMKAKPIQPKTISIAIIQNIVLMSDEPE